MDLQGPGTEHQTDLRQYLAILRARKWTIILITVLVVGSALFFSYRQTPMYVSEARLLVKALPTDTSGFVSLPNLATEGQLVTSVPVATKVMEDLDLTSSPETLIGNVTAEPTAELAQVLSIKFSSPDPTIAQAATNSFAENYIEFRRERADEALAAGREAIQDLVDSVTQQLSEIAGQIDEARRSGDDSLANTLEAQRSVLIARLGILQQRLDDVQPDRTIRLGGGEVIQPAALPARPASPDIVKNGFLALFLGLALGMGLAFLRERLDDRLRGRSDLEKSLEIPVLATVPRFSTSKKRKEIVTESEPHGAASEAYRSLRTNLQYLLKQRDLKSLLITSASAGEGKTVTCVNLAITLARSGSKVILVSADLRRPTLESYFDLPSQKGLSSWLAEPDQDLSSFISDPGIDNLRVMTSGPVPHMPAELLTSRRLGQLIEALEDSCDILLIDSPPTLAVADAAILAAHVDGTLLVVNAHKTLRSVAMRATEELNRVGAGLLGIILNAFDPTASPYYYQPYQYGSGYRGEVSLSGDNGAQPGTEEVKESRSSRFRRQSS